MNFDSNGINVQVSVCVQPGGQGFQTFAQPSLFQQPQTLPFVGGQPFIYGGCGHNSFLCSQNYTGRRLADCCSGHIHGTRYW